jgi:predicted nucleic acid-binding protein
MEQDELAELKERVVTLQEAMKTLREELAKALALADQTRVSRATEQLFETDALLDVARERLYVYGELQYAAKKRLVDDLERRVADLMIGEEGVVDGVKVHVLASFWRQSIAGRACSA